MQSLNHTPDILLTSWLILSINWVCWAWMAPLNLNQQGSRIHHRSANTIGKIARPWPLSPLFDGGDVIEKNASPTPPIAFRDETSFLLAGELQANSSSLEEDGDTAAVPIRQSPLSPHPLLSLPRQIPNPYGWMDYFT